MINEFGTEIVCIMKFVQNPLGWKHAIISTYCGRSMSDEEKEFYFINLDHAERAVKDEQRYVPCLKCLSHYDIKKDNT